MVYHKDVSVRDGFKVPLVPLSIIAVIASGAIWVSGVNARLDTLTGQVKDLTTIITQVRKSQIDRDGHSYTVAPPGVSSKELPLSAGLPSTYAPQ